MVILTPAIAPPCESVAVPAMRPKMLWAAAVSTTQVVNKTANITAAVFNTHPGNSPPQTTWFDLDSFVLTGTPPLEKIEISFFSSHSSRPTSFLFSFQPVFSWPSEEKLGNLLAENRVLHCETASHSISGPKNSRPSPGPLHPFNWLRSEPTLPWLPGTPIQQKACPPLASTLGRSQEPSLWSSERLVRKRSWPQPAVRNENARQHRCTGDLPPSLRHRWRSLATGPPLTQLSTH